RFRRPRGFRRCGRRFGGARWTISFISSIGSTTTGAEHLHRLTDDFEPASLLSGLFIIPRVELKPTLNKNRTSFFQVLPRHLGSPSPKGHIHERNLFAFLTALQRVLSIDRNAEIRDRAAFWCVAHLGITRQISE